MPKLQKKWNAHLEARPGRADHRQGLPLSGQLQSDTPCPACSFCTEKDTYLVSRWCWSLSIWGKHPSLCSPPQFSTGFQAPHFEDSASREAGNNSHILKRYFFVCFQVWEKVKEEYRKLEQVRCCLCGHSQRWFIKLSAKQNQTTLPTPTVGHDWPACLGFVSNSKWTFSGNPLGWTAINSPGPPRWPRHSSCVPGGWTSQVSQLKEILLPVELHASEYELHIQWMG